MTTGTTKQTPQKHAQSKDSQKDNVEYPNYAVWQTRSGNMPWFVSDTKGKEFMKCQHRTGTSWEMTADGRFKTTVSQNREDVTFGKHVSYVTGSQDTTVKGDSSIRTEGTRRTTTIGDNEDTTKGKSVISAKSVNVTAAEQFDIAAQSFTAKTKSTLIQATDGPATVSAVGSATLSSEEGSVGMNAAGGAAVIQASMKVSVKGSEVHISGAGGEVVMKDGKVYINSGQFQSPREVWKGHTAGKQTTEPPGTTNT